MSLVPPSEPTRQPDGLPTRSCSCCGTVRRVIRTTTGRLVTAPLSPALRATTHAVCPVCDGGASTVRATTLPTRDQHEDRA